MKKSLLIISFILLLFGCTNKNTIDDKTIVVGASPSPHKEILEQTRNYIESKGYELKIVEYDDYILPNKGVETGELDANYFQHEPYLVNYNEKNNANLISILKVHYEPLGIYSGKKSTLDDVYDIAIPNDETNRARALLLLHKNNLITLDKEDENVTSNNIIDYKGHNIIEVEAASIPAQKTDLLVCNGNYALSAKITDRLIVKEDENSLASKYKNIIAIKEENKDKEAIKILIEALKQENIKTFIETNYKNTIVYSLE